MKLNMNYLPALLLLCILAGCGKPSLQDAISNGDQQLLKEVINSGNYDPNIAIEGIDVTLFEYAIRNYNDNEIAEKVATHPNLSMQNREDAMTRLLRDVRIKNDEYIIDNGEESLPFPEYTRALYDLMRPLPDGQPLLQKVTLTNNALVAYTGNDYYIFKTDGWMRVRFDEPYQTRNVMDVFTAPEYKEVVSSSPGKELIFYVLHPAGMNPKPYVKVFADPLQENAPADHIPYWNEKLLFAADYSGGFSFDGSMEFPESLNVIINNIPGTADYEGYISWVENNLADFKSEPTAVPLRYNQLMNGKASEFAPVAVKRAISKGFDIVIFRPIGNFLEREQLGMHSFSFFAGVYKDQQLVSLDYFYLNGSENPEHVDITLSIEDERVSIFRKGFTESIMGEVIEEVVYPDTTYYYAISQAGELAQLKTPLPAIAGKYSGSLMYLAVNENEITGFYNNGRYEGNPNFGCSFLFYGSKIDLLDQRKIKITTLNPFNMAEAPREGTLRLHSEENGLFTIVANLNGDDCWDKNLGLADIGTEPGASFELSEEKPYQQVMMVAEETEVYNEAKEPLQITIPAQRAVIKIEAVDEWCKVICFADGKPVEGYIKTAQMRSLQW